jgi:hypothetical protein
VFTLSPLLPTTLSCAAMAFVPSSIERPPVAR